jgi:carbon monoxide dehydrogenase subunit G
MRMKFTYKIELTCPAAKTWSTVQDSVRLVESLPGCESASLVGTDENGAQQLEVVLSTRIGPISLRSSGEARLLYNEESRSLTANVNLRDGRAGAIHGTFTLVVSAVGDEQSAIHLDADVGLAGKLGEFAQPLIRRKAEQTVREFGDNLKAQLQ